MQILAFIQLMTVTLTTMTFFMNHFKPGLKQQVIFDLTKFLIILIEILHQSQKMSSLHNQQSSEFYRTNLQSVFLTCKKLVLPKVLSSRKSHQGLKFIQILLIQRTQVHLHLPRVYKINRTIVALISNYNILLGRRLILRNQTQSLLNKPCRKIMPKNRRIG